MFLFLHKTEDVPIIAETFKAERRAEEITNVKHEVKTQARKAVFTYSMQSIEYGKIEGSATVRRDDLQYKHSIGLGAVVINTSLLGRFSYGYKRVEFSFYGGYDVVKREPQLGFGIGGRWGIR